jgi:hypothetical protein
MSRAPLDAFVRRGFPELFTDERKIAHFRQDLRDEFFVNENILLGKLFLLLLI